METAFVDTQQVLQDALSDGFGQTKKSGAWLRVQDDPIELALFHGFITCAVHFAGASDEYLPAGHPEITVIRSETLSTECQIQDLDTARVGMSRQAGLCSQILQVPKKLNDFDTHRREIFPPISSTQTDFFQTNKNET